MTNKVIRKIGENIFLLLALMWIFLWISPWAIWLDSFPWLKVGLAILIFAVPGVAISFSLVGKELTLSAHFISGLAISVLLIASLGLLGRVFNLPYEFIKPVFALIGLITLLILIKYSDAIHQLYKPQNISLVTLALLLFMFVFGITTNLRSRFGGDDFSYLAYLTNWQHAQPLSFREVIFGSGEIDSTRFWLSLFPMNLAFLAEISHLHGLLLLGLYLEPYLVIIGILAIYSFYKDLLEVELLAIAALLLHFTFFVFLQGIRQPGSTFFIRLSEDKVFAAFILAPIFFLAIHRFLGSSTQRNGLFTLLIGLSLALTHPIILAYSIFIAGLEVALVTIAERNYKRFGIGMTFLIILVLPSVFLRFYGPLATKYKTNLQSALDAYGTSETRFSYIEGTPFYGFDLERIEIQTNTQNQGSRIEKVLSWSYLWFLGFGFLWSCFNLKKKKTAPFILATSLLILLCAIPYTGWLLGYFVTAGMLWRSPWLLPIGLIVVVLLVESLKFILQKVSARIQTKNVSEQVLLGLTIVICILLISYFSFYGYDAKLELMTKPDNYTNRLENLALLGDYLETTLERPSIFVAPFELMDYLPGLSSKAKVVFFRSSVFTPEPVNVQKLGLIFSQDLSISMKQRMNILRKYHIQYIVIEDRFLKDFYASYSKSFYIQKINDFWVITFQGSKP